MKISLLTACAIIPLTMTLAACGGSGTTPVNSASSTPVGSGGTTTGGSTGSTTTTYNSVINNAAQEAIYKKSVASSINANTGYALGATGAGVTIAILDTGIDVNNAAFAGRISSASTSMPLTNVVNCSGCAPVASETLPLQDQDGHGTAVASVAAAAANGKDIQGVAPDATILAINIGTPEANDVNGNPVTASTPQSSLVEAPGSSMVTNAAIMTAVNNGAFVINISSNGADGTTSLNSAMAAIASKNLLLVESVSNNIGQNSFAGQIAQDLVGSNQQYAANFLFGIRSQTAPSENGNPGALANRTLAVNADNVLVEAIGGGTTTMSGNSFAAPAISGAAALMKSYWPQLGGSQIATILLNTADAPTSAASVAAGNISGFPLLDLTNAFAPQNAQVSTTTTAATAAAAAVASTSTSGTAATTSGVAATTSSVSTANAQASHATGNTTVTTTAANSTPSNAVTTTKSLVTGVTTVTTTAPQNSVNTSLAATSIVFSPAFGASMAQAKFAASTGKTVILDEYMRNFTVATGALAHSYSAPGTMIYGALQLGKTNSMEFAGARGVFGYTDSLVNDPSTVMAQTSQHSLAPGGTVQQPVSMVLPLSKNASIAMTANGNTEMSQLVTGSMYRNLGITTVGSTFDFRYTDYKLRISLASNVNQVSNSFNTMPYDPTQQRSTLSEAIMTWKNGLTLGFSSAIEYGSALGLIGNGSFNVSGAHSSFVRAGWTGKIHGWRVAAEGMAGTTKVDGQSNMVQFNGPVWTTGFRMQAEHPLNGGLLTLGLTSPLRVQSASMSYTGPVSYNYVTNTFGLQTDTFNVAPSAREMDLEADWAKPLKGGAALSLGASLTDNTGNVAGQTGVAAWLRYNTKF